MKVQTLSAVVGTSACNAQCPYCVSKMTPGCGVSQMGRDVNWRNFRKACRFARDCGVSTLLLTGKGEPTLYPELINDYLMFASGFGFPFIELQTNGILINEKYREHLKQWYGQGMTTVSLSIAHYDDAINSHLLRPGGEIYSTWAAVELLHSVGLSVRINCTAVRGYIDSGERVEELLSACKQYDVEQVTIRGLGMPETSEDAKVVEWVANHRELHGIGITQYMEKHGAIQLLNLPHGAVVYDWRGQNVCLNNCLTSSTDPENVRQLIFFPDGRLRYDWKYEGAVIL